MLPNERRNSFHPAASLRLNLCCNSIWNENVRNKTVKCFQTKIKTANQMILKASTQSFTISIQLKYTPRSRPHPCLCHTIYSFCSASRRLTHNTNLHKHKVLLQHHHSFFVNIEREFNKILVDFFLLYFHFHVLFSSHQILFVFRLRADDNWGGIIMWL